jgi:hypothetical protein
MEKPEKPKKSREKQKRVEIMKTQLITILISAMGLSATFLSAGNTPDKNKKSTHSQIKHTKEPQVLLSLVEMNDKYGYIDISGKIVIQCQYENANEFSEGLAWVKMNGLYGFIDKNGNQIIKCKYKEAHNFSGGIVAVKELSGYWSLLDKKGHDILPISLDYDYVGDFSNGMADVRKNGVWGFIDIKGNEIIHCQYKNRSSFSEDRVVVVKGNSNDIYLDKNGSQAIRFEYEQCGSFSEGLAYVLIDNSFGYIDKNGNVKISCKYDGANDFSCGRAKIAINGKLGFIDKYGNVVIRPQFNTYNVGQKFSEGLIEIKGSSSNEWGFIDVNNDLIIPFFYEKAHSFQNGLASVKKNGRWGFINKEGEEVIPFIFDYAGDFD